MRLPTHSLLIIRGKFAFANKSARFRAPKRNSSRGSPPAIVEVPLLISNDSCFLIPLFFFLSIFMVYYYHFYHLISTFLPCRSLGGSLDRERRVRDQFRLRRALCLRCRPLPSKSIKCGNMDDLPSLELRPRPCRASCIEKWPSFDSLQSFFGGNAVSPSMRSSEASPATPAHQYLNIWRLCLV
jgi:hypothetical protein